MTRLAMRHLKMNYQKMKYLKMKYRKPIKPIKVPNKLLSRKFIVPVLIFGFFVMSFLISGCTPIKDSFAVDVEEESINTKEYPVLWVNGTNHRYQPMFPNKGVKTFEQVTEHRLYLTKLGIPFTFSTEKEIVLSYTMYSQNGEVLMSKIVDNSDIEKTIVDNNNNTQVFRIEPDFGDNQVSMGEEMLIEIVLSSEDEVVYYYQKAIYSLMDSNNSSINQAYTAIATEMKNDRISFMNEPRMWIDALSDEVCRVYVEFTGAKRIEGGFTYWDIHKIAELSVPDNLVLEITSSQIEKQRYYYSEELGGWNLGSTDRAEDRQVIESDNGAYQVIYNDKEIVLYDVEEEEVSKVYRIDTFDSEYLMDEYIAHHVRLIHVDEEGVIYFSVLGYINDSLIYQGYNGIAFYKYSKANGLVAVGFFERQDSISVLEDYLEKVSFYNKETKELFIFDNSMLYKMNFDTGLITYIETYLDAVFYKEQGLLCWQGNDTKYNGAIYVIDLNKPTLVVENFYQTGLYQRLLGVYDHKIIVGVYNVENTYEYLNGKVIYPFHTLRIYLTSGELLDSYEANSYGDNHYYGSIFEEIEDDSISAEVIEMELSPSTRYESSRVNYVQVGINETILSLKDSVDETFEDNKPRFLGADIYLDYIIPVKNQKEATMIFTSNPIVKVENNRPFEFYDVPPTHGYMVRNYLGEESYTSSLMDAFTLAKDKSSYEIYEYDGNLLSIDFVSYKKIFDSKDLRSSQYLDKVTVIPQRPELPRGCEVTSLAILLHYYMENSPDKMELASDLKISTTPYSIENGFVNFSDMNVEFAGSMEDITKPGLGVYVQPIKELASDYLGNSPTNITGISFEQLLTFISRGDPVLIIIPNRYTGVPSYNVEVWKTNSGYMEVTYQEHSVIVMGFDENYIYYSDPSKGIIDKKPKISFQSGWESMGSQGIVIIE